VRLKSALWVAGYVRRCQVEGAFVAVRRRGAEEAGAIFIKISRLDGTADLYGPASQSEIDEGRSGDRLFMPYLKKMPAPEPEVEQSLERQLRYDPDIWIVEVEDRAGRSFLDQLVR
jgi:hypothetical protein